MILSPDDLRNLSGRRVYAIGDIHGCLAQLDALLARIDEDLWLRPCDGAVEVYLGDYVDRGPDSAGVVERLIERRSRGAICLAGNHELMMAAAHEGMPSFEAWLMNGGRETLSSYGVRPPGPTPRDAEEAFHAFRAALPPMHLIFINMLPLGLRAGGFLFVHAGVRPGIPIESQSPADLATIRQPFLNFRQSYGAFVVHGHTPVKRPQILHNRANIDTGAYATGVLSCLVVEEGALRIL